MNLMFVGVHNIGKTMLLREIRKYGKTTKKVTVSLDNVIRKYGNTTKRVTVSLDNVIRKYGKTTKRVTVSLLGGGGAS